MPRAHGTPPERWHGVILGGGASRRFGRDKVLEVIGGRRLLDAALASLADADGCSVVLGTRERTASLAGLLPEGVEAFPDDAPGRGPMGGLATALARRPDDWSAVLAVDLPLVPPAWWPWLAAQHVPGRAAVVARDSRGRWEPLAALYHGSLAAALTAAVETGERGRLGFQRWLEALHADRLVTPVDAAAMGAQVLLNVNRPEDAAAVRRLLGAGG